MSKRQTYTYQAGRKIALDIPDDQFVARALPERLRDLGFPDAQQVSSASSRVTTRAVDLEAGMSAARHVTPTHHAYYVADSGQEFLITDRILVRFKEPLAPEEVDAFAARYALVQKQAYSDRDYLFQLTDHTGMNPVKLVVKLTEEEPLVAAAEHDLNRRMSPRAVALPVDPSYAQQWHLHTHLANPAFDPRSSSRCEEAWQLLDSFGNAQVVVGVTDDGCKLSHVDFDSPGKFAHWGYFQGERLVVRDDIDASAALMYQSGADHGTSCAGVIAAETDAVLTVGAAPGCRLLPIKWESDQNGLYVADSKMLTVLSFIEDKVDVLSNSWGIVPSSLWSSMVVQRVGELARTGGRNRRGIVFLWAAGNENCPIQHNANLDVPYDRGFSVRPDGSAVWVGVRTARQFQNDLVGIPGVMHVAALASNAQRSHYSNYGPGILICAPTSNGHEYARLTVTGLGVTTTSGVGSGVTAGFGGTSSATPLVAGIAALTLSANPELSAAEVISILKQTASKDLNVQGYPTTPPASFDSDTSWDVSPIAPFDQSDFTDAGDPDGTWSPWFGHGRVDARAAVAEALRRRGLDAQQTLRKASTAGLDIHDFSTLQDKIHFSEKGTITAVKVFIDITHTYVGDLRVTLVAPSGSAVLLHNRSGGNTANIKRNFDATNTAALSALLGQPIEGDWILQVEDLARRDEGRLNGWELELGVAQPNVVELTESPGLPIPEFPAPGIERSLATAEGGSIRDVELSVDITHTYVGDLVVSLVSPAAKKVVLHNRSGGGTDNLIATYKSATNAGLQGLRGDSLQGDWRLTVADLAADDVGKLNAWNLRILRS